MIIPNIWKNNPNVPNHQPDHHFAMFRGSVPLPGQAIVLMA